MISRLIQKAKSFFGHVTTDVVSALPAKPPKPIIVSRKQHSISRKDISENTLKVLYRIKKHGYEAYLVGGGVRDLLLKKHPKDFDVVTNAHPEEIRKIFSNCRLIGRRFRLAHVHFGRDIIEVATFRKQVTEEHEDVAHSDAGMILRDNVYGTIEEDAWRRDFTINALYYNIADFSLIDFTGGLKDIEDRKLRMIGDTQTRYREDPVRMLRAIRFASKLDFTLSPELAQPIKHMKSLLLHISSSRLFEEVIKLFHSGASYQAFELLRQYELFALLFSQTDQCIHEAHYPTEALLSLVFKNTDARIREDKGVTPVFIFAAILWHPILKRAQTYVDQGMSVYAARVKAIEQCLHEQCKVISIPKRITYGAREIWMLQTRMQNRSIKRVERMIAEPRFKAAFDFLLLRHEAKEEGSELAQWWEQFLHAEFSSRQKMLKALTPKPRKKKKKHVE